MSESGNKPPIKPKAAESAQEHAQRHRDMAKHKPFGDIRDFVGGSPFGDPSLPPKEGRPSDHELGVAYIGPWERDGDGFNEHVRRCALALAAQGVPVHLRSPGRSVTVGTPKELPKRLAPLLLASISRYSVQIHQAVLRGSAATNMVSHRFLKGEELASVNRCRVLYSVWERTSISDADVRALNQFGQVWTACSANAGMLRTCGVDSKKIRVVPIPFFPDDPLLKLRVRSRKPGVPRFYHVGKWEPRKAQDQILLAFLRAFKPGEAHLILKTMTLTKPISGYTQGPGSEINKIIETDDAVRANGWVTIDWRKHIEIITKFLSSGEMLMLHRFGDVYVSLSRGEGFSMPSFDAKLAGNRMLYVPSGGVEDFADYTDFRVPVSGTVPAHPFYGWDPDARYLDFDIAEAVKAFRVAREEIVKVGTTRVHLVPLDFSAEYVGSQMLKNLNELTEGKVF
jgi:glycosyltransferase involved in cell wall biosynthesis